MPFLHQNSLEKIMTENQEKEMFNLLTRSVSGIQDLNKRFDSLEDKVDSLDKKVENLQEDVSELKDGQKRIEKELRLNNRAVNTIAGEQVRMDERLLDLEKASV
jgi:septal ring factor EnvC (AmiA/AmiB activator)